MASSQLTLVSVLERAATVYPRAEIVSQRSDGTTLRYRYADLYRRARALAAALQECGLHHCDRVATLMSNHHIQLEASFGVPVAGGMLHALNPHLPADALAQIINHAQDRFLIVDDVLLPAFERIKGRVNIERVIVAPFKGGSSCHRYEEYEDLLHDSGEPNVADLDEMEPAVVCYTLGAATRLEADVYTHRTITLHAYSISRPDDWSIGRSDTILPAVPMFHEHGWGLPYAAVMRGSRLILPGPHLQPERMLDLLSAHRVTLTGAGLTMCLDVLDALEREPHRWALTPGTRIVVGGATAPASMVQRFDAHRVRVIQPRAMTLPIATNSIPELEENISSSSVNAI